MPSPDYRRAARQAAKRYGLDPHLFERQIGAESGFNPSARSGAGAIGIAQIMPATARGWGVNPSDPIASLDAAAKNMASYVKRYGGYENALRAYNAGPAAIEKSRGYAETNAYVQKILGGRDPGGLGSPSRRSGMPQPAAGGVSGSRGQAAPPSLEPGGQGSDFLGLASTLLDGGGSAVRPPTPVPVAAPAGAAAPPMPEGFRPATPTPPKAPEQEKPLSQALGLLEALGGASPAFRASPTSEGANGSEIEPPSPILETVGQARSGPGPVAALGWAKSYLGFRETGENRGGIADYANKRFGMSGQPWCAMFTSLAITKGGAPSSARTASVAEVRRKMLAGQGYQRGYVKASQARPGDLILFGDDHIGMVDRVEGGKVHYVGGNQSDGVTMASVPVGRGDIIRPMYGARRR